MNTHPNGIHRTFTLVLALVALMAPAARAQDPSNTTIDAGATLSIPLEIYQAQSMNFGELVKTAAHDSGEVVVQFDAGLTGNVIIIAEPSKVVDPDPADHQSGAIWFTGDPSKQVVVDAGPSTTTLEIAGATTDQQRMDLDLAGQFFADGAEVSPSAPDTYPMPSSGQVVFIFDADLHVKFDNESGAYSGTIPISLNYL